MYSMETNKDKTFVRNYQWVGLIVVCLASIPLHFVYEWTGENTIAGLFTPINESIWEHLKLVYWPLLLWWGLGYLLFRDSKNLSLSRWFTAAMLSIIISMAFITSWYYIWTAAFEIESSIIDVGSLFIAVPLAQLVAIHVYKSLTPRLIYLWLSSLILVSLAGLFLYFTFNAPDLPFFIPPSG